MPPKPFTIGLASRLLDSIGLRHHLDAEAQSIHVVFVTRHYVSPRSERLAILRLTAAEEGRSCRVSLERAFAAGRDPAATCLTLCRAVAGAAPAVGVEEDSPSRTFRLAAGLPVDDGRLSARQLAALVDAVVRAAEAGQAAVGAGRSGGHRPGRSRGAA